MNQRLLIVFLTFGYIYPGACQSVPADGGLVIYKTQSFLGDNMAQALVFSKSIDHGSASGGSTIFIGANGGRVLVPANGILGVYTAEEINITNLAPGDSINKCKGTIDRLEDLSHLNPNVAATIGPILNSLRSDAIAVDSGKEMVNGQWKEQEHAVIQQTSPQTVLRVIKQARIPALTTTEGDTYKNATYKSSDETKVSFSHADGAARISWDLLKTGDQLAWGYDADKVKSDRLAKKKAEEEKLAAELLAKKQAEEARVKADAEAKAAAEKAEKEKQEQLAAQEAARQKLAATLEEMVKKQELAQTDESCNVVELTHPCGFIDKTGKVVIEPKWDSTSSFSEGLASVELDNKEGFIDKTGKVVIEPKWDSASTFSEGLANVELDKKFGFIDKTGKVVIEPKWDCAWRFSEGLASVELDNKEGFIDKTGKVVIEPKWDSVTRFKEGLAVVALGKGKGYIDMSGNVIVKPKWQNAQDFENGFGLVQSDDDLWHLIDRNGVLLNTPNMHVFPEPVTDGLVIIYDTLKQGYGYINTHGETIINPHWARAYFFSEGLAPVVEHPFILAKEWYSHPNHRSLDFNRAVRTWRAICKSKNSEFNSWRSSFSEELYIWEKYIGSTRRNEREVIKCIADCGEELLPLWNSINTTERDYLKELTKAKKNRDIEQYNNLMNYVMADMRKPPATN
jgi:hypothetical protein